MNEYNRIEKALSFIPADDRETWLTTGMAIKSELGEEGFGLWNSWSAKESNYKEKDARDVWKSITPAGGTTIGTLFYQAKANGWQDDKPYQLPTPEQQAERQRISAEREAKELEAIRQEQLNTSSMALEIWRNATPAKADHPYLVRKQIASVDTLKEIDASEAASILGYWPKSSEKSLAGRLLVVPVKRDGKLSTLELIDGDGRKTALAGRGSKVGGFWATESLPKGNGQDLTLLIGEGVATVLSGKEATGQPAIAALSSSNLAKVAQVMREQYPRAELIILADLLKADGQPDPKAIEAAISVNGKLAVPDFGSSRESGQTDFNDMAKAKGKTTVKTAITNAGYALKIWKEPQPLHASYTPEPYPLDALPSIIRAAVEEVTGFTQAPAALVACSALGALSLATQAHVDVQRANQLEGPCSLFLLAIADSGERKSTCDGYFTKVIKDYEAEQTEAAKTDIKRYKADKEVWEAKKAGIREKIKLQAKNGRPSDKEEQELRDLEQEEPEPPKVPRLIYSDATPEALQYELGTKWPSGGIISAEAGSVFGSHGMSKDSAMRNLATLNVLWDGGSLKADRKTSESFTVSGARLTTVLQVQEATLREFFKKSGELARGTGFLARFLIAWPESTQGFRPFKEFSSEHKLAEFHARLKVILNDPVPMDENGKLKPEMLSFSAEAKRAWVDYYNSIEFQLQPGGAFYDVKDVASKIADNAARLAALFQMLEHGRSAISLDCLNSACQITTWHLTQSRRFFGELALPTETADATRLDSWLVKYCKSNPHNPINKRWLQQHGPVRDKTRLDTALTMLNQLDRLQFVKDGQRPYIEINPALLGLNDNATATPATPATNETEKHIPVANVATVAVANALYPEEEKAIREWLAAIGENNPEEIANTLDACKANPKTRAHCLAQATNLNPHSRTQKVNL